MNRWFGLVIGARCTISLGRTAFWVVFGLSIYFWLARPPEAFPGSLENALFVVLAYNLGSKFRWKLDKNGLMCGDNNDPNKP